MVRVWEIKEGDVLQLLDRVLDPNREDPLVIVSPTSDTGAPRIDVAALAEILPPGTELAQLMSVRTTEKLSDYSPSNAFNCYGGSVRIIRPKASPRDHWRAHSLVFIYPDDDQKEALRSIVRKVEEGATPRNYSTQVRPTGPSVKGKDLRALTEYRGALLSSSGKVAAKPGPGKVTVAPPAPPKRDVRPKQPEIRPKPEREQRPEVAPQPTSKPTPVQPAQPVAATQAAQQPQVVAIPVGDVLTVDVVKEILNQHKTQIAREIRELVEETIIHLVGGEQHDVERERLRADEAEQQLSDARRRIERLQLKYEELKHESEREFPRVFDDEERQLRWEIEQTWLRDARESERVPLKPYTFAPGFLASTRTDIVPLSKTRKTMIKVLTDQHWDISHQFYESKAGEPRVRADGAVAWRTYVKQQSSGAPRLTWWQLTDGTIEFEHVGHHDAML